MRQLYRQITIFVFYSDSHDIKLATPLRISDTLDDSFRCMSSAAPTAPDMRKSYLQFYCNCRNLN